VKSIIKKIKNKIRQTIQYCKQLIRKQNFWSAVSVVVGSSLVVYLLPIEFAVISLIVLFFHELAHYLSALAVGAKPIFPIFIPLGFMIIGLTRIKKINPKFIPGIALSGPIVGAMLSSMALVLGIVLNSSLVVLGAGISLVCEVFSGTIGSDGSIARKWAKINWERSFAS